MNYDSIKKVCEKKTIEEIETMAKDEYKSLCESQKNFTLFLFYLERSNRWRESKQYKKGTFSQYIRAAFGIPYQQYFSKRQAVVAFGDKIETYGIGNVTKAIKKCGGIAGAKRAIDEIITEDNKLKNPISNEKIQSIIKKHTKKPTVTNRQYESAADLRAVINQKDKLIHEQKIMIKDYEEQIARLKATIKQMQSEKYELSTILSPFINDTTKRHDIRQATV